MSIKRNFTIGIMDETKIDQINAIISNYADMSMKSSAHMYFDKQPINVNEVVQDVTFFRLKFDDETLFSSKLDDLIKSLDELDTDYILMDDESGKLIVTVDHGGYITVKFDNVRYL